MIQFFFKYCNLLYIHCCNGQFLWQISYIYIYIPECCFLFCLPSRNIPKTDEEDEEEGSSPSRSSSTSGRSDSKSSTPSKSPNKSKKNNKKNISAPVIELSKDTILPPPNGFDSGSTVSVPDVVPSVTQQVSSAPPPIPRQPPQKPQPQQKVQKAPIAVLAEPEVTFTNGTGSTFKQDRREEKKDGDLSVSIIGVWVLVSKY